MLRPPTTDDIDGLCTLMNVVNRADDRPWALARGEVVEMFEHPVDDPDHDMRVVDGPGPSGGLVAWGRVSHSPSGERLERAFLEGGVHPDHRGRGIGSALMAWLGERADERLSSTPEHLEALALVERMDGEDERRDLFEAFGYADARYFDELQRSLDDLPDVAPVDGIEIRTWTDDDHEPARQVYNAAFRDHWGSTPRSTESWHDSVINGYGTRTDLSFVAVDPSVTDHDGIVGYSLNAHYPDDTELTGRIDGWVESLGTLRSHRRRGIAAALVVRSLHAFVAAGFDSSMIGVDSANPSGAYAIYERLGFRRERRGIASSRIVRPGSSPDD